MERAFEHRRLVSLKTALLSSPAFRPAGPIAAGALFGDGVPPAIEIGKTTMEDLLREFGRPYDRGVVDGRPVWTYVDDRLPPFGARSSKNLIIRFRPDGRVVSFSFNANRDEAHPV